MRGKQITLVFLVMLFKSSYQYGSLIEPPSRNSAWLIDKEFKECCTNYNFNHLDCGGTVQMWKTNGGKCGVCGDSFDGPRLYEKGGENYLGKITRNYTQGSSVDVEILLTANHKGAFEFRICNLDSLQGEVTQECLNKTVLNIKDSNETKYIIDDNMNQKYTIQLPENLTCDHCVLQWKWIAAKDWGIDENGRGCLGCGIIQKVMYNCADIKIKKSGEFNQMKSTESANEKLSTKNFSNENFIIDTTTIIQTSKKPENRDRYSAIYNTCQTRLKFGTSLNFVNLMDIFCENVCHQKCPEMLKDLESNLRKGISTPPSPNIISCLDTCPIVCDCK